jgi:hypothetical protein
MTHLQALETLAAALAGADVSNADIYSTSTGALSGPSIHVTEAAFRRIAAGQPVRITGRTTQTHYEHDAHGVTWTACWADEKAVSVVVLAVGGAK